MAFMKSSSKTFAGVNLFEKVGGFHGQLFGQW
jgi:hypothetical protein